MKLRELYLNADEVRYSSDVVINNEFLEKLNRNRVYHYIDEEGHIHVQRRMIKAVDYLLNDFFSARLGPGAFIAAPNVTWTLMTVPSKKTPMQMKALQSTLPTTSWRTLKTAVFRATRLYSTAVPSIRLVTPMSQTALSIAI